MACDVKKRQAFGSLWVGGLLALAAGAAYSNSLSGSFVYDDESAITNNPSIRHLWPLGTVFFPPGELTVGGRPLLNLTFALNYAVSGAGVWSYHAFNLLVHILAGLALFGVVRRTLLQPVLRERFGAEALSLAAAISLLWLVHPVQTESVTYISQRSESLMGLFYLLSLYGLIRSAEEGAKARIWACASVTACWLGMATKEVMVTAPLLALLYDRTFLAGSFRGAWRRRGRLHAGLMAGGLMLVYPLAEMGKHSVGKGSWMTWWNYAWTECGVVVHDLTLSVWPHPLIFDYGDSLVDGPGAVWPQALLLSVLLVVAAVACARRSAWGFVGAWFFLILAPTSSVIPINLSPAGEHRLYLPVAAVVAVEVLGLYAFLGRKSWFCIGILAIAWGMLTFQRNDDYRTAFTLWRDTVAKCPGNARAHSNFGNVLVGMGRLPEAIGQFREAIRIKPDFDNAQNNWGNALCKMGKFSEAMEHFTRRHCGSIPIVFWPKTAGAPPWPRPGIYRRPWIITGRHCRSIPTMRKPTIIWV